MKTSIHSSLIWGTVERFGYSGIVFLVTILLARFLTPEDFGVIGTLSLFIGVSQILIDSGLGGALIRKKEVNQSDYNTVFTINLLISICLYLILFISAPLIARFYENNTLALVLRLLSLTLIFSALSLTGKVRLLRNLEYKKLAIISIFSVIASAILSISAAIYGLKYWALVIQTVCYYIFLFFLLLLFTKTKTGIGISKDSFQSLFSFGSNLLFSSILQIIVSEGLTALISKKYNFAITGQYYQAKKLVDFPVSISRSIADSVVFPVLSRIEKKEEFFDRAQFFSKVIMLTAFPFFIILFFCSREIILTVLGEKWEGSAKILQILCLGAFFMIVEGINRNFIKSRGKSNLILKSEIIKRIFDIIIIFSTIPLGLFVMLKAMVISNIISSIINMVFFSVAGGFSFFKQLFIVCKILMINFLCGFLANYLTQLIHTEKGLVSMVIFVIIFLIIYLLMTVLLFFKHLVNLKTIINK